MIIKKLLSTVENKKLFKLIDLAPYSSECLFCVGATEDEVIKYIKSKFKYELDDEEKRYLAFKGKSGRVVRFKNNAMLLWVHTDYLPVIAHEVFHVVEMLMESIKTPLNEHTSEPYAYLVESIWRQICRDHNRYLY